MSGGSWDYLCYRIVDLTDDLRSENFDDAKNIFEELYSLSKAMHDIEWVDSCDYSSGDELAAIKDFLGKDFSRLVEKAEKTSLVEVGEEKKFSPSKELLIELLIDLTKKLGREDIVYRRAMSFKVKKIAEDLRKNK